MASHHRASALVLVGLAAAACARWDARPDGDPGPQPTGDPDTVWTDERWANLLGVHAASGDVVSVSYIDRPSQPVLVRYAATDGAELWSVPLPEMLHPAGAVCGDEIALVVDAERPVEVGGVELPDSPVVVWFSTETGAVLATTPAPPQWGGAGIQHLVVCTVSGDIVGAFRASNEQTPPIERVGHDGVRWSIRIPDVFGVWELAATATGDVLVSTSHGAFRVESWNGAVSPAIVDGPTQALATTSDEATFGVTERGLMALAGWRPDGTVRWRRPMIDPNDDDANDLDGWYPAEIVTSSTDRLIVLLSAPYEGGAPEEHRIAVVDRRTGDLEHTATFEPSVDNGAGNVLRIQAGAGDRIYAGGRRLRALDLP